MLNKFVRGTVVASGLAVAVLLGTAATAHAGNVQGACTKDGRSATGWVHYTYESSLAKDKITKFTWDINGQSGSTLNDVILELKRDVNNGSDTVHYAYSTSSADNGNGSHTPSQTTRVSASWNAYGRFNFIFDINNEIDPSCVATTSRF
ncbi:hypothetical protein [Streptosporangium sp. KLBMP 9127]|nr:hypothetical protein [Streptosporangium sp. KLBMP 9127]